MSDYTPTTEEVRERYASDEISSLPELAPEFDRWLAEVKAQAWEEGYVAGAVSIIAGAPLNPYRQGREQCVTTAKI